MRQCYRRGASFAGLGCVPRAGVCLAKWHLVLHGDGFGGRWQYDSTAAGGHGGFAVLETVGFLLQLAFDRLRQWLYRYMPQRTANIAGFLLLALIVVTVTRDGVLDRLIAHLDQSMTLAQNLFDTAPRPPLLPPLPGGRPCNRSASMSAARRLTCPRHTQLALAELKRLGGFDRKVLIVAMATGTEWLPEVAVAIRVSRSLIAFVSSTSDPQVIDLLS